MLQLYHSSSRSLGGNGAASCAHVSSLRWLWAPSPPPPHPGCTRPGCVLWGDRQGPAQPAAHQHRAGEHSQSPKGRALWAPLSPRGKYCEREPTASSNPGSEAWVRRGTQRKGRETRETRAWTDRKGPRGRGPCAGKGRGPLPSSESQLPLCPGMFWNLPTPRVLVRALLLGAAENLQCAVFGSNKCSTDSSQTGRKEVSAGCGGRARTWMSLVSLVVGSTVRATSPGGTGAVPGHTMRGFSHCSAPAKAPA